MLKLDRINKIYRTDDVETSALSSVSVEINKGEFVAVMGPSGCGKSTFLNIVGMLDSPDSGAYYFQGEDIADYTESELAQLRKTNIGFIFQSFNLIDELSVRENIELALLYHRDVSASERKRRVKDVMERMNISHRAGHMPGQLSGGQQQRVAVARALVAEPALILADEPTGNLDSQHGEEVMSMLSTLHKDGATILMVTHSETNAACASRLVNLFDGHLVNEALSAVV